MHLARCLLLVSSIAAASGAEYYAAYIDKVFVKSDVDTDGVLTADEIGNFVEKVDCGPKMTAAFDPFETDSDTAFTNSKTTLYTRANTDSVTGVTKAELTAWIEKSGKTSTEKAFADCIIVGMTGIDKTPGATTSGIGVENTKVTEAKAFIELVFTMTQNPEDLFIGERKSLRSKIINLMSIPSVTTAADLFMTISAGSGVVEAKAYVPTEAEAKTGKSNLATALPDKTTASAALGVTVESKPTIKEGQPYPVADDDITLPASVAGIAVVLGVLACCLGKFFAKKRRASSETKYDGCCSTGCCSPYALQGWSAGVVIAVLFMLGGMFVFWQAMGDVKTDVVCIIDKILELKDLGGDAAEAISAIDGVLDTVKQIKPYIEMIDLISLAPAAVVVLTLIITAGCGQRDIQTMKWMKCFALTSLPLLIVCIVFYAIFSAVGYAITFEAVQEQFIKVTSLCETSLPTIKQTLTDAESALKSAKTLTGVDASDMSDLEDKVSYARPAANIFEAVCDCINNLFFSINKLFIPGLCCVSASVYALWTVFAMCCAGKCCCRPRRNAKVGGKGVEMKGSAPPATTQEV